MNADIGKLPSFVSVSQQGVTLAIKLQPRSSSNVIGTARGSELPVKVTAPPVDSAANEALLKLLAQTLDCPKSRVELVRGKTSRHKVVRVHGVTADAILEKLG